VSASGGNGKDRQKGNDVAECLHNVPGKSELICFIQWESTELAGLLARASKVCFRSLPAILPAA
jgi:hypothetical protein